MEAADHENCTFCSTADFLPLRCRGCHLLFCHEHHAKSQHECNAVVAGTSIVSLSNTDNVSVKSIFTNVEKRHDHLFDDNSGKDKIHAAPITSSASAAAAAAGAGNIDTIKSLSKLEKIASGGSSSSSSNNNNKQARIAQKTKDLLLKGKAVGTHKDIDVDDRFYVMTTLTNSGHVDRKCIYCNTKTTTVGDLCDWVGKTFSFPIFKAVIKPVGKTVFMSSSTTSTAVSNATTAIEGEKVAAAGRGDEEDEDDGVYRADYDRTALVSSVLTPMQHVLFSSISIDAAVAAQDIIVATIIADKQDKELQLQFELEAKTAAEKKAKEELKAKNAINPEDLHLGDTVVYEKDGSMPCLAKITGIHRDDYPNLYFTIKFEASSSTGTCLEKQTTSKYLSYPISTAVPVEAGGFGINLTHSNKLYRISGIGPSMLIIGVKMVIQEHTGVLAKNQKIICKGKILNDTEIVSSTKLTPGCKVTLMGKK